MPKKKKLTITAFLTAFGSEAACRTYLHQLRWPQGFVCPHCGCTVGYTLHDGHDQCANCRHQTSLTAGTVMHRSHLPLTKWFLAFYLVSQDKRGISAVQLARQVGTTYKTAW
ncbi:MAG: IS1595 family transposase, partial [Oscillospiraceae bacterium]